MASQGFLVGEACIGLLEGETGSLCSAMRCPVVSLEVSMGLVCLWAVCMLNFRTVPLHCWRISMVCLALKLVGSWVELDFSVGIEAFR